MSAAVDNSAGIELITEEQVRATDYSEILVSIHDNQIMLIEQQQAYTQQLAELTQVCWWIFFILLFYGIYKIFLGNLLSWFNGS